MQTRVSGELASIVGMGRGFAMSDFQVKCSNDRLGNRCSCSLMIKRKIELGSIVGWRVLSVRARVIVSWRVLTIGRWLIRSDFQVKCRLGNNALGRTMTKRRISLGSSVS
jgi:hypothetical protein